MYTRICSPYAAVGGTLRPRFVGLAGACFCQGAVCLWPLSATIPASPGDPAQPQAHPLLSTTAALGEGTADDDATSLQANSPKRIEAVWAPGDLETLQVCTDLRNFSTSAPLKPSPTTDNLGAEAGCLGKVAAIGIRAAFGLSPRLYTKSQISGSSTGSSG